MFHGPTGLFWIGFFDRINLGPIFFNPLTLTPNKISQTFWPKEISHVMSGTIFFICAISAISFPLVAPWISVYKVVPQFTQDSEDSDNLEDEIWYYRWRPVALNNKVWVQLLANEASSSVDEESQKDSRDVETLFLNTTTHISSFRKPSLGLVVLTGLICAQNF